MKEELRSLIADLKSNVSYLRELGVKDLWVKQEETIQAEKVENPKLISEKRIEASKSEGLLEMLKPSRLGLQLFSENELESRTQPVSIFDTATFRESQDSLEQIRLDIGDCRRCPLYKERTQIVHSKGNPRARLMFIGEAPGADEDRLGEPFVGRAGQLLTKIIEAINLKREDVFIGNINRCRPPGNRTPTPEEAKVCREFIIREVFVVRPVCIVTLGSTACQYLLDIKVPITKIRGQFQDFNGIKVMPTFHPAYLLRYPLKKREVWEDMQKVRDYLKSLE